MAVFKQKALIAVIAALVVTGGIWWGCADLEKGLAQERATIEQEFYQLPIFNMQLERQRIMKEFRLTEAQLQAKPMSRDEVKLQLEKAVDAAVKEKFPEGSYLAALMKRQQEIIPAKIGDTVQFNYRGTKSTTGVKVSGVFQMKEKTSNGTMIYINGKSYLVKHIDPHLRYMFDEAAAERTKVELVNTFKTEFDQNKEKYAEEVAQKLEEQIYIKAGYTRYGDGSWVIPAEIMATELVKRQKEQDAIRNQQYAAMMQHHKVWGMNWFNIKRQNW